MKNLNASTFDFKTFARSFAARSALIAAGALSLGLVGCGSSGDGSHSSDPTAASLSSTAGTAISVADASSSDCANGGKVYTVYADANSNGILDSSETVISKQTVCNGQNGTNGVDGKNGLTTLFSMKRVTTGLAACASGSGLQINSGVDANVNNTLDASEITQTQVLCDGKDGAPGAAGPAGSNGHSVVFQMTAASADQCPTGGSVIVMATDVNDTGIYSATLPNQQATVICNGANAAVTPYTPVDMIVPCGPGANREVLMRLADGRVLASMSSNMRGGSTRLAILADGGYMTTDGYACHFALYTSADGKQRGISWNGLMQASWPMISSSSSLY